jgi:hypothetical protein
MFEASVIPTTQTEGGRVRLPRSSIPRPTTYVGAQSERIVTPVVVTRAARQTSVTFPPQDSSMPPDRRASPGGCAENPGFLAGPIARRQRRDAPAR